MKVAPKTLRAFRWIVGLLRKQRVSFRIAGGLAAQLYGAERPLADIDIEVSSAGFPLIASVTLPWAVFGPRAYRDKNWDIPHLLTLNYHGQLIDLSGTDGVRGFDAKRKRWTKLSSGVARGPRMRVMGTIVRVLPRQQLIDEKKMMNRRVDRIDLSYLT